MKFPRLPALLFATLIGNFVHAQSTDNPLYRHIPADADKVFHVNFSKLSTNIDWKSLTAMMPKKDDVQQLANYLSDPGQVGVDAAPGVLIAQSNSTKADSPQYTTVLFALSDSGKLIKLLKEKSKPTPNERLVIHPGKPRTATQGKTTFAWNDKLMVMTFVKAPVPPGATKTNLRPSGEDATRKYLLAATRKAVAALKGFENSPYLNDNFFREGFADDADFHIYTA